MMIPRLAPRDKTAAVKHAEGDNSRQVRLLGGGGKAALAVASWRSLSKLLT
jgi:hypothetical protein